MRNLDHGGTLAYTHVGPTTSYVYLAAALLVLGLGIGSTNMPSMARRFHTLSREETPKARANPAAAGNAVVGTRAAACPCCPSRTSTTG